jgi:hypothetical protein
MIGLAISMQRAVFVARRCRRPSGVYMARKLVMPDNGSHARLVTRRVCKSRHSRIRGSDCYHRNNNDELSHPRRHQFSPCENG